MRIRAASRAARHIDPVPSLVILFVANFLLQRVSIVPGKSVPIASALALGWVAWAWFQGVVRIEAVRFALFLLASAATALVILPQLALLAQPEVRIFSWAFWLTIWLPGIVTLRAVDRNDYQRLLRALSRVGVGIATLSVVFLVSQYAGLVYRDYFAEYVPDPWQVHGFVISYPLTWDSPIYRSNGWIALEPSFMSFTLGVCLVAGLLTKVHPLAAAWMALGILATVSGSGAVIVLVGLLLLLVTGKYRQGVLTLGALGAAVVALSFSPFGQVFLGRSGEILQDNSSASLRAVQPYTHLYPVWVSDWAGFLFGRGAGSSRTVLDDEGIAGLLLPNIAKVLFDYGIIAGGLLLAVIVVWHTRSPEIALGWSLLASFLVLQGASEPLLVMSFIAVTWWAPSSPSARPRAAPSEDELWRSWATSAPSPPREPMPAGGGYRHRPGALLTDTWRVSLRHGPDD